MFEMRDSWTDKRLDDFAKHTDQRFDSLESQMVEGFRRVDGDIRELRSEMNSRFDALQRTLLQLGGAVIVALLGLVATQL
jgi:hypothetical protein